MNKNRVLITLVVYLIVEPAAAQMPELRPTRLWKPFKITENQEVLKIVRSPGGRYFTAGTTYSKEDGAHYWVGELSEDGKKLWGKSFDAENQARVLDFTLTDAEHLLLAGERYSGGYEGWVVKYSLAGEQLYERTFRDMNGRGLTTFSKALPSGDSCHILVGRSNGDAYLVKIDREGNSLWEKKYDLFQDDWVISRVQHRDGTFFLAVLSGKFTKFGQGESKVSVIHCDAKGNRLRDFTISGNIWPTSDAITILGDHVFLTLSMMDAPTKDCAVPPRDAWILCFDSRLKELWKVKVDGAAVAYQTPSIYPLPADKLLLTWKVGRTLLVKSLSRQGMFYASREFEDMEGLVVLQGPQIPRLFLKEIKLGR